MAEVPFRFNDATASDEITATTLTDGSFSVTAGAITGATTAVFSGQISANATGNSLVVADTLRIAQTGSGLRMTNVGGFDNDGSTNFVVFGTNDLILAANGESNTAITIDATAQDVTVQNDLRIGTSALYINGTQVTTTATELNQLDGVTLGTAASSNVGDFATAAQGATADTALQIVAVDGSTITGDGTPGNPLVAAGGGGGISIGDSVGSGTSGSILFVDASTNLAQDNGELYWDNTNNRLGIGTTSPSAAIEVDAGASTEYAILSTGANGRVGLTTQYGGIHINNVEGTADLWQLSERDTAQFDIAFGTPDSGNNVAETDTQFRITSGGNVGIGLGSTNPSQKLHVSGTIRQTNSTSAVLVSDGNGDIGSASNLQDVSYYQARPPEPPGPGAAPVIGNWFLPSPANFVGWIDIGGFFVPAFQ